MSDITQLTDAELHARLQAIHDELQQMQPASAKTDEPIRPLAEADEVLRWAREQPLLEGERRRIRSELRGRDEQRKVAQG